MVLAAKLHALLSRPVLSMGALSAMALGTQPLASGVMQQYLIAALYHFTSLPDFRELRTAFQQEATARGIKGTLLLAEEGINGTLAGSEVGMRGFLGPT